MLRCPVCGKLSLLQNFVRFHKLDAVVLKIKGLGRGRGFRNTYEKSPVMGDLAKYWIKRLKEVITYLENLSQEQNKKAMLEIPTRVDKIVLGGRISSSVMQISALPKMELKSESTQKVILNVPKCSLSICMNKVKK